jgi:hypothetical protein
LICTTDFSRAQALNSCSCLYYVPTHFRLAKPTATSAVEMRELKCFVRRAFAWITLRRGRRREAKSVAVVAYAAHADEIKLPPVDMPLIVCKKASQASARSLCNVTLGGCATLGARRETTPATVTIITIMTCWSTFIELYSYI